MKTLPTPLSVEEFDRLFQAVCNWGRWGPDDQMGTLNYITSAEVRRAAALVQSGRSVSMAIPINTVAGPDNPHPAVHYMVQAYDVGTSRDQACLDYLACECHGYCHTHLDALCHFAYEGKLYNGRTSASVTSRGPSALDITAYSNGIVGRGVLLDIARLRGVKWLEPGEAVTTEELEAAETAQGVRLERGDIFVFRTGHHRRRTELGPWDNSRQGLGRAGLHATVMPWLHERQVAAFFPDGDGETEPGNVERIACPIQALQIAAMGMACADSLQFEELVKICEAERRWEFMVTAAPLRLPGGTGSLFNPLAIF
jgi:kynurenine formamidase